jgi:hypothetical protein
VLLKDKPEPERQAVIAAVTSKTATLSTAAMRVRFAEHSGSVVLSLSFSPFDPSLTSHARHEQNLTGLCG